MEQILKIISLLAISQLVFMAIFNIVYFRKQFLGKLLIIYILCLTSYVISLFPEIQDAPYFVRGILLQLTKYTPAFLWLFTYSLFDDETNLGYKKLVLVAVYITSCLLEGMMAYEQMFGFEALELARRFLMILFACHAIYIAYSGFSTDLVEKRREMRLPFVIAMTTIVLAVIILSYLTDNRDIFEIAIAAFIYISITYFNFTYFRLFKDSPEIFSLVVSSSEKINRFKNIKNGKDAVIIENLKNKMKENKYYKNQGLTILDLAKVLSIHEYQLRKLINKTLKYKNFNQFVNGFRIDEAKVCLENSNKQYIPISTIAYDTGFSSLSTFNKAFKDHVGMSPTTYRNRFLNLDTK